MKNAEITESFLITEEDFVNMQLSKSKYLIPKENKIILRVMGIIAILCGAAAFINVRGNVYQIICWFLLIVIGLYALSYYDVINPSMIRKNAFDFYRFHQKAIYSKTVEFTDESFTMSDQEYKVCIPKKYIYKIVESKTTVFIFTDRQEFSFIPKRVLSKEQIEKVRSFLPAEKYKII